MTDAERRDAIEAHIASQGVTTKLSEENLAPRARHWSKGGNPGKFKNQRVARGLLRGLAIGDKGQRKTSITMPFAK